MFGSGYRFNFSSGLASGSDSRFDSSSRLASGSGSSLGFWF